MSNIYQFSLDNVKLDADLIIMVYELANVNNWKLVTG